MECKKVVTRKARPIGLLCHLIENARITQKSLLKVIFMTEEELQTRVIENIRALRKRNGLSQEKLADKADISRQMMNDIEGRRRWLTKGILVKIVNALGVDVHELFIPFVEESSATKNAYAVITQKVILQVKEAVDRTLDEMSVEVETVE